MWYILEKDGNFKNKQSDSISQALYGEGSWNLWMGPYPSEESAQFSLDVYMHRIGACAIMFSRKQIGFHDLKEAINDR